MRWRPLEVSPASQELITQGPATSMAWLRDPALGRKVKEEPDLMTALSKVRPLRSPTHSQPYLFWLSAATYIGENTHSTTPFWLTSRFYGFLFEYLETLKLQCGEVVLLQLNQSIGYIDTGSFDIGPSAP